MSSRYMIWYLVVGYLLGMASWLVLPHQPPPACTPP
jgi:hypothetical protein